MKDWIAKINYFAAAFWGIFGLVSLSDLFMEDDLVDKIDELIMLLLGLAAIFWYRKSGFKSGSRWAAALWLFLGILVKAGAIVVEHNDAAAVGDDIGIIQAFVFAFVFVLWQILRHREAYKEAR